MTGRRASTLVLLLSASLARSGAAATVVPIGAGANGIAGLELAPLPGIEASAIHTAATAGHPAFLSVNFTKAGEERRLLALEAPLRQPPSEVKALSVHCTVHMTQGDAPRLALIAFEKDGGAWFRVSPAPMQTGELTEARLPLASFRRAAFAQDDDQDLRWEQVGKLWLCLAFDGRARGQLILGSAVLTSEPYRPTQALKVTNDGPGDWSVSHDRAATAKLSTPPEAPGGKPSMRLDYAFPGGRHMYVVPSVQLGEIELEGYKALRFACKGALPEGIDGLLVMLIERDGTQYYADPPPQVSGEWRTVTVPFDRFQRGGWSQDDNDRLDLNDVGRVAIGLHGTASKTQGKGTIWVANVQFVP